MESFLKFEIGAKIEVILNTVSIFRLSYNQPDVLWYYSKRKQFFKYFCTITEQMSTSALHRKFN